MATLNENITRIEESKIAIKNAIIGKGVAVDDTALLDTYASKIIEIPTSGGGIDVTGTGWENEPTFPVNVARLDTLNEDLDYTRKKYSEWEAEPDKTSLERKYNYDKNLIYCPKIDTSKVTDMGFCFDGCSSLTSIPQLDTSKVTNMRWCFDGCSSLTTIPQLDTSKVESMTGCFNGCTNLTSVPKLDTSKVTNMNGCFQNCTSLTSIPQLNTSKVTNMVNCFYNCSRLTTIPQLDTSAVTDMSYCFDGCSRLTTIPQLDTSAVTNMTSCFHNCYSLKSVELTGGIRTDCNCTDMFKGVTTNGVLKLHVGNGITRDNYQPVIDKLPATWTVEEITDELPVEKKIEDRKTVEITSNGTTEIDPSVGFDGIAGATVNVNVPTSGGGGTFELTGTGWETELAFPVNVARLNTLNEDLDYTRTKYSEWEAEPDKTNLSQKYNYDKNLIYCPKIDTSAVTNMEQCFVGCTNLTTIPLLDTSAVTTMKHCFNDCKNLTSIPQLNTSQVTSMQGCFIYCTNLTTIPQLDFSKVTDTALCFAECFNLANLGGFTGLKTTLSLVGTKTGNNKITRQSLLNVINNLGQADPAYSGGKPVLYLGQENYDKLTAEEIAVGTAKGWQIVA